MIRVIYGKKGSGKTKRIIDACNECATKDVIVYLTDNDNSLLIDKSARFINVSDYDIGSQEAFKGFICGLLASNFDVNKIFIDGFTRVTGTPAEDSEGFFKMLDKFNKEKKVDFVITVSAEKLPAFLVKYADKAE